MLTVRNNACRVDVGPSHGMRKFDATVDQFC